MFQAFPILARFPAAWQTLPAPTTSMLPIRSIAFILARPNRVTIQVALVATHWVDPPVVRRWELLPAAMRPCLAGQPTAPVKMEPAPCLQEPKRSGMGPTPVGR